jgi:carboxypeptidase Q
MLGLGGSLSTPPEGIEAEVVVITDYKEFETKYVRGKIVLYDNGPWRGYNTEFR